MCQFFSCVSDGTGKLYYFGPKERQVIYDGGKLPCKTCVNPITTRSELDSHSGIVSYYGLNCDKVNKYEYRPLDKKFAIDQINIKDDHEKVRRKLCRMDFGELWPPGFIVKQIFHPFNNAQRRRVTHADLLLLKRWASVWDSVRDSVRASVRDSVGASVRASVRDSVWDSVRASVGDSVRASVGASVWDSVGASVWAYVGSFFNLPKWEYIKHKKGQFPFQVCVDLWEKGLVPSFDGKVWRLHGHKGKILKEITKKELRKLK